MTGYRLIGIHGAPRSGTSWLGQLFNSHPQVAYRYQPFFSFAFRGQLDETSSPQDMDHFFDQLLVSDDAFVNQTGNARLARRQPDFVKTEPSHLVYKEVRFHDLVAPILAACPQSRFIGIIRDPKAVLASWWAAPREFSAEWKLRDEWRWARKKNEGHAENWYGYERWKELANLLMSLSEQHPAQLKIVRYEDLTAEPEATLTQLFHFCGLELCSQTRQFLEDSTTQADDDPYGVYRKHHDLERNRRLPDEISEEIDADLATTPLEQFLESAPTAQADRRN